MIEAAKRNIIISLHLAIDFDLIIAIANYNFKKNSIVKNSVEK